MPGKSTRFLDGTSYSQAIRSPEQDATWTQAFVLKQNSQDKVHPVTGSAVVLEQAGHMIWPSLPFVQERKCMAHGHLSGNAVRGGRGTFAAIQGQRQKC